MLISSPYLPPDSQLLTLSVCTHSAHSKGGSASLAGSWSASVPVPVNEIPPSVGLAADPVGSDLQSIPAVRRLLTPSPAYPPSPIFPASAQTQYCTAILLACPTLVACFQQSDPCTAWVKS